MTSAARDRDDNHLPALLQPNKDFTKTAAIHCAKKGDLFGIYGLQAIYPGMLRRSYVER